MVRKIVFIIVTILLFSLKSFTQTYEVAEPLSFSKSLDRDIPFVTMTSFDKKSAVKESHEAASKLKRKIFGKVLSVDLHPYNSGVWAETNVGRIWRLGITSKEAYSLYLIFNKFQLQNGVRVFVYTPNLTEIVGAFTDKNNSRNNIFAIAPISGDSVIIEMNVPEGVLDFGFLELRQVAHDYMNEFGKGKSSQSSNGLSLSCNIDINCQLGAPWQDEKRAVCKFTFITPEGRAETCTGTFVNNLGTFKHPYVLTAYHCMKDSSYASSFIMYYNYEKTACKGVVQTKPTTVSGCELIATTDNLLDFSLVKLYHQIPAVWNSYLAGWNAENVAPQSAVCIHHPNGDVKKITITESPLVNSSFNEGYDENAHWLVNKWTYGVTEGGSSGAPIFNDNHQIVGTLSGGPSPNCDGNDGGDQFIKFSLAWDFYHDSTNQLKYWLDPQNKGISKMDGRNLYNIKVVSSDTISHTKEETVEVSQQGLSWGYISGHNSLGYTQFAEQYYVKDATILSGLTLNIAHSVAANPYSFITVNVWNGGSKPEEIVYSTKYYIRSFWKNEPNFVYFDSLIVLKDTFYVGYTINYATPSDTFAVYHSANRNNTYLSRFYIKNKSGFWKNVEEVTSPKLSTSLDIGILVEKTTKPSANLTKIIRMYPNPCTNQIVARIPDKMILKSIQCANVYGQYIPIKYHRIGQEIFVVTTELQNGTYILIVNTLTERLTQKFVVFHNK